MGVKMRKDWHSEQLDKLPKMSALYADGILGL
jgi:hypothetical protein